MRILITGGSGTLGTSLRRAATGHTVRISSRRSRPPDTANGLEWSVADPATGEGLAAAVDGVDAVVHCASNPRAGKHDVDVEGTHRLLEAASDAGVRHFVYPSIVGIDDIPFPYYRRKREAERIVEAGDVPYSILRTTQFHEFIDQIIGAAMRVPIAAPLPTDWPVQSVAASEVAGELVRLLQDGPAGRCPNFAGPEVMSFGTYARTWMAHRGKRKRLLRLPVLGKVAAGFREGRHTDPDHRSGRITWDVWLESVAG